MSGSPDWVRDGLAQFRAELVLFVRTLWSFVRHPRRFTRGWLDGQVHALNPFGYLLTAIGFVGGVQVLAAALGAKLTEDGSLWLQLAKAALPPLYYLSLGLMTHLVLWLLGSRRARLRDTAAIALYAGGPAYIGSAFLRLLVALIDDALASVAVQNVLGVLVLGCFLAFAIPFVGALREIHDVKRAPMARSIFAFVTVFALSGFFFGGVRPPGNYGLHPTIWPPAARNHDHWIAVFGD